MAHVRVEQNFDFYQNLPEFPFSTRHFLCSFIFEMEWGQFDYPIRCFFILSYTTGSHFKILSISEIIFISALGFLQTIDSHSMIVDRKVKPEAESEQKESRISMARISAIPAHNSYNIFQRLKIILKKMNPCNKSLNSRP